MSYYKEHAKEFIEDTIYSDMSEQYRFFEKHLKSKGTILDVGFGSGRDSLYFKSKGYEVFAIDPEEEFVNHAKEIGLKNVYLLKAEYIDYLEMFDGIWACASFLHVSSNKLEDVFKRCSRALKSGGVMYASFKYGDFEGERNGRFYLDLNKKIIRNFTDMVIVDIKVTKDVRSEKSEKRLNVILRKDKD